jgi:hypothetical protein
MLGICLSNWNNFKVNPAAQPSEPIRQDDPGPAAELLPLVYEELRKSAIKFNAGSSFNDALH